MTVLKPYISPKETYLGNKVVKSDEQLVLTIQFLATGEIFTLQINRLIFQYYRLPLYFISFDHYGFILVVVIVVQNSSAA